jgi:hypothetical protein
MGPTALCIYRVKAGKEEEFKKLLVRHWNTMTSLGLAGDVPPRTYQGKEKQDGEPIFFELFTWKDASGPETAHKLPEVAAIWEPMGALCESREGKPAMEFPHVEEISLG